MSGWENGIFTPGKEYTKTIEQIYTKLEWRMAQKKTHLALF